MPEEFGEEYGILCKYFSTTKDVVYNKICNSKKSQQGENRTPRESFFK